MKDVLRRLGLARLIAVVALSLAWGTASTSAAPFHRVPERIGWSVGPCGNTCPAYRVQVRADGLVSFEGVDQTSVVGRRSRMVDREVYRELAAALSPYRPAYGTVADTECARFSEDEPTYRITWSQRDGHVSTLRHNLGCSSPHNAVLNAILLSAPEMLMIDDWSRVAVKVPQYKPHIFY